MQDGLSRNRACCVCNNISTLMHDNLCRGTSYVMRNILHNAIQSRCHESCFNMVRMPGMYYDRYDVSKIEAGPRGGDNNSTIDEGIANRRHFGARKRDYEETSYSRVEFRQHTWGYSKRKKDERDSTNTEDTLVKMKNPNWKNKEHTRGSNRRISSEQNSIEGEKDVLINENTLRKRTRFKEDIEILEHKNTPSQKNSDKRLKSKSNKTSLQSIESNVKSTIDTIDSSIANEEICLNAIPTQKELEDKLLDLYHYILSYKISERENNSEASSEIPVIDQKGNESKRTLKRRKHLYKMNIKSGDRLPERGRYRKVDVARRSGLKLRKHLLKECNGIIKELLNDVIDKLFQTKENCAKTESSEVVSNDPDIAGDTHMERKYLEIELSSLYTGNKGPVLPVPDEQKFPPISETSPSTLENNSLKDTADFSLWSDRSSIETLTKESTWKGEDNATRHNLEGRSSILELRGCKPVTQFPPDPCWEADGRLLRDVLGYSKSLPSSATPSKLIMRKQVKCVLRRSPPVTSLRRNDARRRHHTQTVTRKMLSRSELISHSEHSDHYYMRRDSTSPLKSAKKGNKTSHESQRSSPGLFQSLQRESFSSSLKISRLERDMSYQTVGKSEFEEILPPKVVKESNTSNKSLHDEMEKVLMTDTFSSNDARNSISSGTFNALATNRKKNLVLETFQDVLQYIKEKKTQRKVMDPKVAHNTISSFPMKDQTHIVKSAGSQVLESFCDYVRYLRDINATTSNVGFPRYRDHDHVVTPNPDGDAKERVRAPMKFGASRKHNSTQGGGSLVLETFREVLKLIREEEGMEITDGSFSPRQKESYLFFEMHNRKMFSDSELRVNVPQGDGSKLLRHPGNTGGEMEHTFKADKPLHSADQRHLCTKLSADLKDLGRRAREGHKESVVPILRQLFHLPLFDNLKKTIKDSTSRKNGRCPTSRAQEDYNKVPCRDMQNNPIDNYNTEEVAKRPENADNFGTLNKHSSENVQENMERKDNETMKANTNPIKERSKLCSNMFNKRCTWPSIFKGDLKEEDTIVNDPRDHFNTTFENELHHSGDINESNIVKVMEFLQNVRSDIIPTKISSENVSCTNKNIQRPIKIAKNISESNTVKEKEILQNVRSDIFPTKISSENVSCTNKNIKSSIKIVKNTNECNTVNEKELLQNVRSDIFPGRISSEYVSCTNKNIQRPKKIAKNLNECNTVNVKVLLQNVRSDIFPTKISSENVSCTNKKVKSSIKIAKNTNESNTVNEKELLQNIRSDIFPRRISSKNVSCANKDMQRSRKIAKNINESNTVKEKELLQNARSEIFPRRISSEYVSCSNKNIQRSIKIAKNINESNTVKEKELLQNVRSDIFPRRISSRTVSCANKDIQTTRKISKNRTPKDPSQRKFQRNVKGLEKIASERYCYLRRRTDVEKEELP